MSVHTNQCVHVHALMGVCIRCACVN